MFRSLLLVAEHGQLEAAPIFEELERRLRLHAQAVQANEALGGVVVKLIARLVGGQFLAVKAVIAFAANDRCFAFEELDADRAADETLIADDESGQILMEAAEPQSII